MERQIAKALALSLALVAGLACDRPEPDVPDAQASPAAPGPRLAFDETFHDFGVLTDTEVGRVEFRFRNAGTEPLEILDVSTSCGCTATTLETRHFAPGAGDVIAVEWKPKGVGRQTQSVRVLSNDDGAGLVSLQVNAVVEPAIALEPLRYALGHLRSGAEHELEASVRFRSAPSDGSTRVTDVRCSNEHVRVDFEQEGAGPNGTLFVRLLPTAPKGRFHASVRISATGKGLGDDGSHQTSLPINATLYETIRAEPNLFNVGSVPERGTIESVVRLMHDDGLPFQIIDAEVVGCALPLAIVPRPFREGTSSGLELVLQGPAGDYVGSLSGVVTVMTDSPGEGPLTFPLLGRVGSR